MKWITDNWVLIGTILYMALNVAAVIVAKTANKTDDKVVGVIRAILLRLSLVQEDANGNLKLGVPLVTGSK